MTGASDPTDPESRLAELLDEEQRVSARRRRLQDRIDFFRGSSDDAKGAEELEQLLSEERRVSAERRELQAEIDELRALLERSAD